MLFRLSKIEFRFYRFIWVADCRNFAVSKILKVHRTAFYDVDYRKMVIIARVKMRIVCSKIVTSINHSIINPRF